MEGVAKVWEGVVMVTVLTDEREFVSAAMELIGYDTTNFLSEVLSDAESAELGATSGTVWPRLGVSFCRTRETTFDILTAAPGPPEAPLATCLACRFVPVLVTLVVVTLLETELMMAVALAMPCLVSWLALEGWGDWDPPPTLCKEEIMLEY